MLGDPEEPQEPHGEDWGDDALVWGWKWSGFLRAGESSRQWSGRSLGCTALAGAAWCMTLAG
jgi:hypothetical protein